MTLNAACKERIWIDVPGSATGQRLPYVGPGFGCIRIIDTSSHQLSSQEWYYLRVQGYLPWGTRLVRKALMDTREGGTSLSLTPHVLYTAGRREAGRAAEQ